MPANGQAAAGEAGTDRQIRFNLTHLTRVQTQDHAKLHNLRIPQPHLNLHHLLTVGILTQGQGQPLQILLPDL